MYKRAFLGLYASALMASVCFAAPDAGGGGGVSAEQEKIKAALRKLDPESDDDWTEGGLPAMARVKELSGVDDLNRQKVGEADPGFNRDRAAGTEKQKTDGSGQTPPSRAKDPDGSEASNEAPAAGAAPEQTAEDLIQPNLDPASNPNVGETDLGPYEGQAHTADQRERLHAEEIADESASRNERFQKEVDAGNVDAIELIELAMLAAQSQRYRRNGELQNLVRHYQVNQIAIKDMQGRLDQRDQRREDRRDAE